MGLLYIFGGAYTRREFYISKWIEPDNENNLKQLHSEGLVIYGRLFHISHLGGLFSEGLICGGAYFQNFMVCCVSLGFEVLHFAGNLLCCLGEKLARFLIGRL